MTGERRSGPGWTVNSVAGAVVIGTVVQGRDITVRLPPGVPSGLNGWRSPAAEFVGRTDSLAQLLALLDPDTGQEGGGSPPAGGARVAAVAGLGGIGKTELALQAVRHAAEHGWFPGGVLPIDLHGYAPESARLDEQQAVASLLRGSGGGLARASAPGGRV
ncbi:hypothetical protein [Actinomadura litoris]|uniref:hypothetical protein n=1 Tax=Actinomadura litoris TaxID=2678616 RepID=UPI001FA6D7CF|nr:hypothetical protein [Actinomadura litoris]